MSFAALLVSERQIHLDAIRVQPEFAAFETVTASSGDLQEPFRVLADGAVMMGDGAFTRPALLAFYLRHGLELSWLLRHAPDQPVRAALAAARAAALFASGEPLCAADQAALPVWTATMQSEIAPDGAQLTRVAKLLGVAATAEDVLLVRRIWSQLGTAEAVMETGGDIRLARDPRSALNGYGCSHRPRPWAVTFASSTASSSSERGYVAADMARLRSTAAMLGAGARQPVRDALHEIRAALGKLYGLGRDGAVVLAASGTDTELLALAVTHLAAPAQPILSILIAPEETGSGVPMAARGLHFAVDTALGHDVSREAPIEGFRPDTELANIMLRAADGSIRPAVLVEAEIEEVVEAGLRNGRRVILHALDLSKTGLLSPGLDCLQRLRAAHGSAFDIVVDACQARLSPNAVKNYLRLDAVVLVTGSKFFTGPPFAGAALIPAAIARRFQDAALPAGLDAYFGRDEFPLDCKAASALPPVGNYGLALRWHAALAEIHAVMRVPVARRARILGEFADVVAAQISMNPALRLLPAPSVQRAENDEPWERLRSIFTFSMAAAHAPGRKLTPVEARAIYLWLNTDISGALPHLSPPLRALARRICHIGQPVKLPQPDGSFIGVLRVSAGARLISGEPSHRDLSAATRLAREFADLRAVFGKIDLILRHFPALWALDPQPRYRPPATVTQTA